MHLSREALIYYALSLAAAGSRAFIRARVKVCFGCLISISELRPCEV